MPAPIQCFHHPVQDGTDKVVIWESGKPMREFLHVDDMAAASVFVMVLDSETYIGGIICGMKLKMVA